MIFDQTQVDAIQRVLKLNLSWMVQNASIFQPRYNGVHMVRARPSAGAIKSYENSTNLIFWANSGFLKGVSEPQGARPYLIGHWYVYKWKVQWN